MLAERWADHADEGISKRIGELREVANDLEMQLFQSEERGWLRLAGSIEDLEFSWEGRQELNKQAYYFWRKNPLAGRAVDTVTNYTFGRGVDIRSKNEKVNGILQEFLNDRDNKAVLTNHEAQRTLSDELQVFGNVYFALFAKDGKVKVSTILDSEVADVILDVNNRNRPLMYKRSLIGKRYDYAQHAYKTSAQSYIYYPDWRALDDQDVTEHLDEEATGGAMIRHLRVNRLSHEKFGISELYRAMDWLSAYNKFLEDWASITAAFARFAWKKKVKGGPATVAAQAAAAKSGLATTLGRENNPPSAAGATIFENMASELTPIRTQGATTSAQDGRYLKLMVSAATGIFEHYFGDPSTGNLATASAMELPMLKMFESRQELWTDCFKDIVEVVLNEAGLDGLPPEKREVEVIFPAIIQKDVPNLVKAIVEAVTLGQAGNTTGLLPMREATALVVNAFGVENPDKVLENMYPAGEPTPEQKQTYAEKVAAMAESVNDIIESMGG